MPVTPFHFGPGAALHATAPKHVSFLAFCAANVLIDLESLYNLRTDTYPVHQFFHTYIGASLVLGATIFLFLGVRRVAHLLPNVFEWKTLTLSQVGIGAAAGAYSHVLLDSIMHADMTPLAPFSRSNILLHIISVEALHWSCVIIGGVAMAILSARIIMQSHGNER